MANQLLTLSEAAAMVPTRPNIATCWRWCRKGIVARNGVRIRLPHLRAGRRILIDADALVAFFRSLAEADVEGFEAEAEAVMAAPAKSAPSRSAARRAREIEAAEARIRAAGI